MSKDSFRLNSFLGKDNATEDDISNIEKGNILEEAQKVALEELELPFKDTSHIFNGLIGYVPLSKEAANGRVPDFLLEKRKILFECKNWYCQNYSIGISKAREEIHSRASNFSNWLKILTIAKPKWVGKAKQFLLEKGWKIIKLGFEVTKKTFRIAVGKIKYWFKRILRIPSFKRQLLSNWAVDLSRVCYRKIVNGVNMRVFDVFFKTEEEEKGKGPPKTMFDGGTPLLVEENVNSFHRKSINIKKLSKLQKMILKTLWKKFKAWKKQKEYKAAILSGIEKFGSWNKRLSWKVAREYKPEESIQKGTSDKELKELLEKGEITEEHYKDIKKIREWTQFLSLKHQWLKPSFRASFSRSLKSLEKRNLVFKDRSYIRLTPEAIQWLRNNGHEIGNWQ